MGNSLTVSAPIIQERGLPLIQENTLIGSLPIPEERLKIDILLDELSQCESGNRNDIKVLDTNGRYSYGRYQFQLATLKKYAVYYGYLPGNLENVDYENWSMDGQFQRKLAKRMIEDGGGNNWYNCLKNKQ